MAAKDRRTSLTRSSIIGDSQRDQHRERQGTLPFGGKQHHEHVHRHVREATEAPPRADQPLSPSTTTPPLATTSTTVAERVMSPLASNADDPVGDARPSDGDHHPEPNPPNKDNGDGGAPSAVSRRPPSPSSSTPNSPSRKQPRPTGEASADAAAGDVDVAATPMRPPDPNLLHAVSSLAETFTRLLLKASAKKDA